MNDKLNTLLACLPDAPFKTHLLAEIEALEQQLAASEHRVKDLNSLYEFNEKTMEEKLESLKAQAGEQFVEKWNHGCNVIFDNIDLWINRCPHCGLPAPSTPAAEPAKPVCFGLDDCSSRALSVCSVRDDCGKAAK